MNRVHLFPSRDTMLFVGRGYTQDEYDEVLAQYIIEKAQLDELEIRFAPLNVEFQIVMEEHDDIYRTRQKDKREATRRLMSALAIQAWWRAYRIRKATAIKVKKQAKLAKKMAKLAKQMAKLEKMKKWEDTCCDRQAVMLSSVAIFKIVCNTRGRLYGDWKILLVDDLAYFQW